MTPQVSFRESLLLHAVNGFAMGMGLGFVTIIFVLIAMLAEKLP